MPYPWIKLYVETKDDPKILALSDAEFRVWINLLLNVSDTADRGTMAAGPVRGLAATLRVPVDVFQAAMVTFAELGMAHFTDEGGVVVDHFLERQYDKPSDYPEATRERKARERARDKSETPEASHADVTPKSRAPKAESRDVTTPDRDRDLDRELEEDPGSSARAAALAPSEPKPVAEKALREDQRLWAALATALLPDPKAGFTRGARSAWNAAIKDLREAGVTPEEIPTLCHNYEVRIGKKPPTPHALVSHLPEIRGPIQIRTNGHAPPLTRTPVYPKGTKIYHTDDDAPEEVTYVN